MNLRASSLELFLRVFLVEGDVEGRLENIRHVLLSIFDAENFGESLELIFEVSIGRETKIVLVRSRRLEDGWRALRRRLLERRFRSLRDGCLVLRRWCHRLLTGRTSTDRRLEDGLWPESHEVFLCLLARHPRTIRNQLVDVVLPHVRGQKTRYGETDTVFSQGPSKDDQLREPARNTPRESARALRLHSS